MRLHEIASPGILRRLRAVVPTKLAAVVPDSDLLDAYHTLRHGHALDKVRYIEPRSRVESIEAIEAGLTTLAREVQSGVLSIYRTVETSDPEAWVNGNLSSPISLGIYWSFSENYVMAHAENERVLFYAQVEPSAVNWAETIVLSVDGVEDECRLRPGAPIRLIYSEPEGRGNASIHRA